MKNKIFDYRQKKGLTLTQLAQRCGLARYNVVQRYEANLRTPPVDIAIRLARALDTTVEELFILDEI